MIVFLVGMPGSGKTYWLNSFAEVLEYKAIDLDTKIIELVQKSVVRLIRSNEPEFRIKEREALIKIIEENASSEIVVATGGGTPCFLENLSLMKENGIVVYLKADPLFLMDNVSKNMSQRPLLPRSKKGLMDKLYELIEIRSPYYEQADLILPANRIDLTSFKDLVTPLIERDKKLYNE